MPVKKFLRRNTDSLSKLGLRRKKLQKWRKPKGRDNQMRLKRKGYAPVVKVGYKSNSETRSKVDGKEQMIVQNISDLEKGKDKALTLAKVGKKKRIEIAKAAMEKNISFTNLDVKKFLSENEKTKEAKK